MHLGLMYIAKQCNYSNSVLLHTPYMKWIGLNFDVAMRIAEGAKITERDFKKAQSLLHKPYMAVESKRFKQSGLEN